MLAGRGKTIILLILAPIAIYLGVLNLVDRAEFKQPEDGLDLVQTSAGVQVKGTTSATAPVGIQPG
ncbi:MAG: hypothetical protein ACWGQW_17520, partial [bacterium]